METLWSYPATVDFSGSNENNSAISRKMKGREIVFVKVS